MIKNCQEKKGKKKKKQKQSTSISAFSGCTVSTFSRPCKKGSGSQTAECKAAYSRAEGTQHAIITKAGKQLVRNTPLTMYAWLISVTDISRRA